MANIIVAFSKPEDAKSIKNILMKNGFEVVAVCTSGAQVLSQMEDLNGSVWLSPDRYAVLGTEGMHERGECHADDRISK